MDRLKGKRVLVTAAGQGIGHASALAMAAEGAEVFATDLSAGLLQKMTGIAGLHTAQLDVTDRATVFTLIDGLGALDVLFNCAGYVHQGSILDCTEADWDRSFAINVRAMMYTIQAALPRMLERSRGSIINMASVVSSVRGLPNRFAYGASKAAVVGLTKSVAADYVGQGIRCNAICPGTVDTPSLQERIDSFADPVAARRNFIARQPMGRLATAPEIAPLVVFLASDEAAFVTGNAYSIDGGMTI
ncbi:MAG: SDR family oxidoreductase [Burkholderiaceae bacterium]|jgi:2-keto-3-deoxy-L-fuconate dehydrogenase